MERAAIALPGGSAARWVISDQRAQTAKLAFELYRPSSVTWRLPISIAPMAVGSRYIAGALRRTTLIGPPDEMILNSVREINVQLSAAAGIHTERWVAYLGSDRPDTRIVFGHIVNGAVAAFSKLATNAGGSASVVAEIRALEALVGSPVAPEKLASGVLAGLPYVTTRAVIGKSAGRQLTDLHHGFLKQLARIESPPSIIAIPGAGIEAALDPSDIAALVAAIQEAHLLDLSTSHGDFTPWNSRFSTAGLVAVDWEAIGRRIRGWDIVHYLCQTAAHMSAAPVGVAARQVRARSRFELARFAALDLEESDRTIRAYAAQSLLCLLRDERPIGDRGVRLRLKLLKADSHGHD